MSEKKRIALNKPPVPARPKNLVVFNSKHLPKPPETFSTSNFIKDLNLDVKGESGDLQLNKSSQFGLEKYDNSGNSDAEEDAYGYLEPASLPVSQPDATMNMRNGNGFVNYKKTLSQEDTCKLGEIFQKIMLRNSTVLNEESEVDKVKPPAISHSQWQRPLPLPPVETRSEVTSMPWYKNIDRRKGEEILKNGVDGYFLVRPSSNVDTYLTLTLWYNKRVYNIPIRLRKDGKFALGTPKANEQCFDSVESMVKNYQSEKLVLYSSGVQAGKTLLTTYPP